MRFRLNIKSRRAISTTGVVFVLGVTAVATGFAWLAIQFSADGSRSSAIETVTADRGSFTFTATETGEIESSNSVEIRCDVKARNSSGTTIIEVVPEGTFVQEGDFLVKLDSSALELDLNAQRILEFNSKAAMIEAENVYETAKIAKIEYIEGTFKQEEQTIQGEIFIAEENQRRAEEYLKYTQKLAARGYATELQVEADRFAVDKARNDLANAKTKLAVLGNFTKTKMVTQLESDIQSAFAKWESAKSSYELDVAKRAEIESQIASCTLRAPAAGQVKYANRKSYRGSNEVIIEPGAQVREGQAIIRMPDPTNMQVKAEISEDNTKYVKTGMPATIVVNSVSQDKLDGRVLRVNDYPEPTSFFSSSVKKYETIVDITSTHENLRPGLTAELEIIVAQFDDVLRVPLQSVLEHVGHFYCILKAQDGWRLREVEVGLNNDSMVVIRSGLEAGNVLVQNPRVHRELVTWPDPSSQPAPKADGPLADRRRGKRPPTTEASADNGEPTAAAEGKRSSVASPAGFLTALDRDRDGSLSAEEIAAVPEPNRGRLLEADANGDGSIDASELARIAARRSGSGE